MDETAAAALDGIARVFDVHALKTFAPDKRVRTMLFKTDQLWSEMACYEPGRSTPMHQHPREEEAIFVLQGTATMSVGGRELTLPAGSLVEFPNTVLHDVRNLGPDRCVIVFLKAPRSSSRGSSCSPSRRAPPRCSPTCRRSPGAPAPAW